jgi:hypothetical protein
MKLDDENRTIAGGSIGAVAISLEFVIDRDLQRSSLPSKYKFLHVIYSHSMVAGGLELIS